MGGNGPCSSRKQDCTAHHLVLQYPMATALQPLVYIMLIVVRYDYYEVIP